MIFFPFAFQNACPFLAEIQPYNAHLTKKSMHGLCSDAASRWAEWALAHPEFGSSVNPTPSRGADYAHHSTACPPGFENLKTSLAYEIYLENKSVLNPLQQHIR